MTHCKNKLLRESLQVFTNEMDIRLAQKESAGYTGWNEGVNYGKILADLITDVLELSKDNYSNSRGRELTIDIANRAMMLNHQLYLRLR